jgi:hypothetical protein
MLELLPQRLVSSGSPNGFYILFRGASRRFPALMGQHEAPRRRQKVSKLINADVGQAHEHDRMVHVVIRQVVRLWIFLQQRCSVLKLCTDNKRPRFGGSVYSKTRDESPAEFERRRPVHRPFFHVGQREANLTHSIEGHGSLGLLRPTL